MIIEFSEPVIIPSNYTNFNDDIIDLKLLVGADSDPSKLKYTWQITDFTDT